jgi:hypothetical protein
MSGRTRIRRMLVAVVGGAAAVLVGSVLASAVGIGTVVGIVIVLFITGVSLGVAGIARHTHHKL